MIFSSCNATSLLYENSPHWLHSSDVSGTNINVVNKSAMEYVDNYNKRLERTNKIKDSEQSQYMQRIYDVMTGKMPLNKVVEVMKKSEI